MPFGVLCESFAASAFKVFLLLLQTIRPCDETQTSCVTKAVEQGLTK